MVEGTQTNGYVRWRDLDEREQRIRSYHDADIAKVEAMLDAKLMRGHDFFTQAIEEQKRCGDEVVKRIDAVESVLDQQRGAKALVVFLIGSNLALVITSVLSLLVIFR